MADRMTVKGLGKAVDGTYEFDLAAFLTINGPEALTTRERHKVKTQTGLRGAEIAEAALALDASVWVSLAAILLERNGKVPNEQRLWDCRFLFTGENEEQDLSDYRMAVLFQTDSNGVLSDDDEDDEEDDSAVPPALAPPTL